MKKILYILLILFAFTAPVFADKTPVKIEPAQIISTHHDEIEVGDKIKFQVIKDVEVDGKIYLKAGTVVYGIVDFVHNNGWAGDSAEIKFTKFITQNINGEKVVIEYPISFVGNHDTANAVKTFLADVTLLVRGAEVYIEPDSRYVNIFLAH